MEIYEESKMHVKKENNRKMRKYRKFDGRSNENFLNTIIAPYS